MNRLRGELVSRLASLPVCRLNLNRHTGTPAHRQTKRGFTLIELLITAAIMALVSLAILSVLAGGLNVYSRVRGYSSIRTDILLSLEKMENALRNVSNISQIDFVGEAGKVTFPAVVNVAPGSVSYYIDEGSNYLVSEERDYSAATAEEPPKGKVTELVRADEIEFSYYRYDPETAAYEWKEAWVGEKDDGPAKEEKPRVNTPLGVRIRVTYEDRGSPAMLERTVFFPLAVSLHHVQIADEK